MLISCVDGECTSAYSISTTKSVNLHAADVSVSADLGVEIVYKKSSFAYTAEEYTVDNLVITPNFETIQDSVIGTYFGSFSDWWDD